MSFRAGLIAIGLGLGVCLSPDLYAATPTEIIRETRTVMVDGIAETWLLVWTGKPKSACGPDDVEMSITCPCSGFAYGEMGQVWLVRKRAGQKIERLNLSQFFKNTSFEMKGQAILQRWPEHRDDYDRAQANPVATEQRIVQRTPVILMNIADYNHDGRATEFLLQVDTLPCGKRQFIALGLSADGVKLQALTSKESAEPLILNAGGWAALKASPKPRTVEVWPCDDHGSAVHSTVRVSAHNGIISAKFYNRQCRPN
ncbi:hypothetical protein [Asticcacaulis sp. YBE204]|uniref:hypothetical protein n=1 Tax=Asticcacaulis sp. YBE204 TaxID=1282363 RepID=UPI0003C4029E|nr:hypothetical protein [Asticcacaulis sp. YBE204]ESQ79587.1 hypothetical protein AEYBE204_07025 [Asticcacaulis sp. YBE204]